MNQPLSAKLASAHEDILREILREVESRLNAQLTAALAADLRAMTYLGFVVAAMAVLVGGTLALIRADNPDLSLAAIGTFSTLGMAFSAYYAFDAAKPIDFGMVGNDPSEWISDIEEGKLFKASLAEMCAHYDEMVKSNRVAMKASSDTLLWSAKIAICTIFASGFLLMARLLHLASS